MNEVDEWDAHGLVGLYVGLVEALERQRRKPFGHRVAAFDHAARHRGERLAWIGELFGVCDERVTILAGLDLARYD